MPGANKRTDVNEISFYQSVRDFLKENCCVRQRKQVEKMNKTIKSGKRVEVDDLLLEDKENKEPASSKWKLSRKVDDDKNGGVAS